MARKKKLWGMTLMASLLLMATPLQAAMGAAEGTGRAAAVPASAVTGAGVSYAAAAATVKAQAAQPKKETTVQVKTQPVRLIFDDKELTLPKGQHAFIHQARTYVPIRYLSYALLKQVGWDPAKNQVTISEPTAAELADLKKKLLAASGGKPSQTTQTLTMKVKEATLIFNGKAKALPEGQSLFILNGSIYVPLRFLAESLGTKIDWDPATRTVSGQSKAYQAEHGESNNGGKPGDGNSGTGGGAPGAGNGGGGGAPGGGTPANQTYAQITSGAESKLYALRSSCESTLTGIVLSYTDTSEAGKKKLKSDIQAAVATCTGNFETIIADTSAALTAGGHSTAILAEYRTKFEEELEAGRKLAESML
ncbi:hypothetical protein B1748_29985 [Paenibacillus sp. MY03]|uniref:stalk domain-containing protein n=1 Tax=Paenibacillus sp. MY03 TaxID=302980 RepID=UPI000B3C2A9F|nr:stalk domain-containing protein [Paenibacillus sp. MY03]OUS69870.1 hypothetical protein B1748_29985 [Paenibacillus sp. MY03]